MGRKLLFSFFLVALVIGLSAAPGWCGSLTLINQSPEAEYCAVFDLWAFSGPDRHKLYCPPNQSASFNSPMMQAIGKIAVYKLVPGATCENPSGAPQARSNPDGMLLPTRSYAINISQDGAVSISQQ